MTRIRWSAQARAVLLAHAREEAPRECCGLLVGTGTTIDDCIRTANLDQAPNRSRIAPAAHLAANRRLRGSGRGVIGAYHSHPHSPAIPSPTDYREAYYSDFIWLIVSLGGASGRVAAAQP